MRYKKNKVLIFACIEKNIGDDLFIRTLCERYPNRVFVISKRAKYGSIKKISNLRFSKLLELWLLFDNISLTVGIKGYIVKLCRGIIEILLGKFHVAVYIVGNAFKNTCYSGKEQLNWLERRMNLSEEFFVLSTNFGPYYDKRWKDDSEEVFSRLTDICFRDKESFNLFSNLDNVRYAPDAILSINAKKKREIHEKTILISIIDCSFGAREQWLQELTKDYEDKIVELVCLFSEKGYKVVIVNSNKEQDYPASERILNQCQNASADIFDYLGDLKDIEDLYGKADYVIGTRLHTIILGWIYSIPVFPIIYDIKVENMIRSYNFNGSSINIRDISGLDVSKIEVILRENKGAFNFELFDQSKDQFEKLDKFLNYGAE